MTHPSEKTNNTRARSGSLSSNDSSFSTSPRKPYKKKPKQRHVIRAQNPNNSPINNNKEVIINTKRISPNNSHRRGNSKNIRKRNNDFGYPKESDFLALDCEMVGIGEGGYDSSAARVTIIDWFGNTLLDEYIQQSEPVTDYRTFISGVTEEDLQGATMTLEECRETVLQLLQNRILVGHALKNDFNALGITHPWWLIRDTAKFSKFMKVRVGFDDGKLFPRKLKDLANERLHREIQVVDKPHCPYEDALAALDLYRSVRRKWENMMIYKLKKTSQIIQQQQQAAAQ